MTVPKVFLDTYAWDLRSRNSDWTYVERKIPCIAQWETDIQFVPQHSFLVTLRANYKAVRAAVGRRVGIPVNGWTSETDSLSARELNRSKCNVVFSHREFPLNAGVVPVVWMSAIVDPEMMTNLRCCGPEDMQEEYEIKGRLFRKATIVQVCTDAEATRHAKKFPDIADRFVAIPLFGPHLTAAPKTVLEKHSEADPVRLLFVGNAVRLKGLQEIVDAYMALPEKTRMRTEFTIVSNFDRGRAVIPKNEGIKVMSGLKQVEVIQLMRIAHILVNPSHFESYGMVFLESMSQGTLCIGPDWEVQRELFDYGRAGMNVRCEVSKVRDVLLTAIEDKGQRMTLATEAWHRYNERYAPMVVARLYADLFRAVVNR